MKKPAPYICDVCNKEKTPSNGWLIMTIGKPVEDVGIYSVAAIGWKEDLADLEGAKHLCGVGCATKMFSSLADSLVHKPEATEAPSPLPKPHGGDHTQAETTAQALGNFYHRVPVSETVADCD